MKKEGLFLLLSIGILGLLTTYSNCGMHLRPAEESPTQTSSPAQPGQGYTVGGEVIGPIGRPVKVDFNGQTYDLEHGSFVFPDPLAPETSYDVTILEGPGGAYVCSIDEGQGVITDQNINNITITCLCEQGALGAGTLQEPYLIYTAEQLNDIAQAVQNNTASGVTYMGSPGASAVHYKQMCDLNYQDIVPTPLGGNVFHKFRGVYDGQGFAIVNYVSDAQAPSVDQRKGLFTRSQDAIIHDLILRNFVLEASDDMDVGSNNAMGALIGWAANTEIYNIQAQDIVLKDQGISLDRVGGLIGFNSYLGCAIPEEAAHAYHLSAENIEIQASQSRYVGGIIGFNEMPVHEVRGQGLNIQCNKNCGGFAGTQKYFTAHNISIQETMVEAQQYGAGLVGSISAALQFDSGEMTEPGIAKALFQGHILSNPSDGYIGAAVGFGYGNSILNDSIVAALIETPASTPHVGFVTGAQIGVNNTSYYSGISCQACTDQHGGVGQDDLQAFFNATDSAMASWSIPYIWRLENNKFPQIQYP